MRVRRTVQRAVLGSTLLCAALVAAAQDRGQTPDVVVTAPERTVIEQFMRNVADPPKTGQVPVWEQKVCPGVVGLDVAKAMVLNARIEQVAALVRRSADEGCRPNTLIIVTDRAKPLAATVARTLSVRLKNDRRSRIVAFGASDRPVRWISETDIGTFDGSPMVPPGHGGPAVGRMSGSRIQASTRTVIASMLVIVDVRQIAGTTLGALGDYLGMVAVARPSLDGRAPAASILSLFDKRDGAPQEITGHDRAYLAALYSAPQGGTGSSQQSAMRARMERETSDR